MFEDYLKAQRGDYGTKKDKSWGTLLGSLKGDSGGVNYKDYKAQQLNAPKLQQNQQSLQGLMSKLNTQQRPVQAPGQAYNNQYITSLLGTLGGLRGIF